jgi:hypothetical protein
MPAAMLEVVLGESERHPDLGRERRQQKAGRQHTDDGVPDSIQDHRLSDDSGVGTINA